MSNFSCPPAPEPCPPSSNQGWRYYLLATGGLTLIMWIIRLFVFNLPESPMYLMSHGRDEEAVAVVHRVAAINKKTSSLTVAELKKVEMLAEKSRPQNGDKMMTPTSVMGKISEFHTNHVRPLFATRVLAYSTSILIVVWGNHYFLEVSER